MNDCFVKVNYNTMAAIKAAAEANIFPLQLEFM